MEKGGLQLLILTSIEDSSKTVVDITKEINTLVPRTTSAITTLLEQYRHKKYVRKARSSPQNRIIYTITKKGRDKLYTLMENMGNEWIADFGKKPFTTFDKIILQNVFGNGEDIVLEKSIVMNEVEEIVWKKQEGINNGKR